MTDEMKSEEQNARRQFLKTTAAIAGGVAVSKSASVSAQITDDESRIMDVSEDRIPAYGRPSNFENSARGSRNRYPDREHGGQFHPGQTPLQDLYGDITPNALHYVVSHGTWTPDIDPAKHKLLVNGLVDNPLIFSLDEIKRFPSVTRQHFLMCAGSSYVTSTPRKYARTVQETHGWTSCAQWTGVPLSTILNQVGVQKEAKWVVTEDATRKWSVSVPLEKAMDDTLLVYGQNGEAIRPEQGYPLRFLAPGYEGTRSTKWLSRIKLTKEPYLTRWETAIYSNLRLDGKARWFQFEFEPNSVITYPSGDQQLSGSGFYEITGLAWSGAGKVSRVEVSVDGGRNWQDAVLQEPVQTKSHTRFRFPWQWNGRETIIMSRCTDERGDIQPSIKEISNIWGVDINYWTTSTNRVQHLNPIQPWKIMSDGSVHNVIWEV